MTSQTLEVQCGCCYRMTPVGMTVRDEDFGDVCMACDLELAEHEWEGAREARKDHG